MKPRLPTATERRLWRESNKFTRDVAPQAAPEDAVETMEEVLPAIEPARIKPAVKPTATKEAKPPLKALHGREATRLLKSAPPIDATLDLHGLSKTEAHVRVQQFIGASHGAGARHLLIITGKGRDGEGVLRGNLPHWLNDAATRPKIAAFAHARPEKGGAGVLHVLLKRHRG